MDPRRQESVSVAATMPVATLGAEVRSRFLVRTYLHLYAAIVAFTLIEAFLFVTGLARVIAIGMLGIAMSFAAICPVSSSHAAIPRPTRPTTHIARCLRIAPSRLGRYPPRFAKRSD